MEMFQTFVGDAHARLALMLGVAALIALVMPTTGYLRLIAASLAVSTWGTLALAAIAPGSWGDRELHWAQMILAALAVVTGVWAGRRSAD